MQQPACQPRVHSGDVPGRQLQVAVLLDVMADAVAYEYARTVQVPATKLYVLYVLALVAPNTCRCAVHACSRVWLAK